jgi:3-oxoacid CoA-transferase subunit B
VNRIITDLGVIDVTAQGLELIEHAPGISVDEIRKRTEAPLRIGSAVREVKL